MKKIRMVLLLSLVMLLPVLTGCGKKGSALDPKNPTAVVIWHYYNGGQKEAFDELLGEFNETVGQKKGIIVSAESKGVVEDLVTAVMDSSEQKVGADPLPDAFATYADTAIVLYNKDLLVNIGEYLSEEELSGYLPVFLQEGEMKKGKNYILPIAKSTELLYLNQTDWDNFATATGVELKQLGTWEGLAEVAEEYYQWSNGKAFFGRDAAANYLLIGSRQLEKEIFSVENGEAKIQLDESVLRKLWDNYAVPYLKGYYGAYGRFRSDDVKTGDLIACTASTSSVSYFPTEVAKKDGSTYPITGLVCPLPGFEGQESYAVQQGAGMAVVKSEEAKEEAVIEFLKWFTEVEQNTKFCVDSGYFPVKIEANTTKNMESALTQGGLEPDSLPFESAILAMDAVNNVNLYTNRPFEEASDLRKVLTDYMTTKIDSYLEQLKEKDESEKDALIDSFFQQWYAGLKKDLVK